MTDPATTSQPTPAAATDTKPKRRRLGKGLSGLIGEPVAVQTPSAPQAPPQPAAATSAPRPAAEAPAANNVSQQPNSIDPERIITPLAVGAVIPNRFQPRRSFDDSSLKELAASITRDGVMQPILVRPASGSGSTGGRYELIAGERRWRAAKLAGLERVPAIVRAIDDSSSAEWALIENVHREDLNAIERGDAIASMIRRFGLTQAEAAERLSMDRSSVANLVRLTELESPIRDLIGSGALGLGHGKALLSVEAGAHRERLAKEAAGGGWSVRRLEAAAKAARSSPKPSASAGETPGRRSAVIASLERKLSDELGTRVRIKTNTGGTKGRLEIEFFGLEHFDGLVARLGVQRDGG